LSTQLAIKQLRRDGDETGIEVGLGHGSVAFRN
jgi:hypothetical protein